MAVTSAGALPKLGRYQVLNKIAQGGMAEIFLAKRLGAMGFERTVAIKLIHAHLTRDSEFVKMFIDEARIAMHLQHRNIVTTFDLDKADDTYFIAMEYVHGVNLYDVYERIASKGRWIELPLALYIIKEVCTGLQFAHTRIGQDGRPLAIVHRDISPQNILLSFEGEVKITDFGIAKAAERLHQTMPGIVKGKYAYMAPEVLQDQSMDARVDVFAAGVVLYELLVGENPFAGNSAVETIENVLNVEVPAPTLRGAPGSPDLDRIVLKALAKDPEKRYRNAQDLADALTEHGLNLTMARRDIAAGDASISVLLAELFPEKASKLPGSTVDIKMASPVASPPAQEPKASAALSSRAGASVDLKFEDISNARTQVHALQSGPKPSRISGLKQRQPSGRDDEDSTSLDLEPAKPTPGARRVTGEEPTTDQDLQALDEDERMSSEDRTILSKGFSGYLQQQISMDRPVSGAAAQNVGRSQGRMPAVDPSISSAPSGPAAPLIDPAERPTQDAPPAQFAPPPSGIVHAGIVHPGAQHPMAAQMPPSMNAMQAVHAAHSPYGSVMPVQQQPYGAYNPAPLDLGSLPSVQGIVPGSRPDLIGQPAPTSRRMTIIAAILAVVAALVVVLAVVHRHFSVRSGMVTIAITSMPAGARVTINGQEQATPTPLNATVPAGRSHTIVITAPGHRAYTGEIRRESGDTTPIHAVLDPQ